MNQFSSFLPTFLLFAFIGYWKKKKKKKLAKEMKMKMKNTKSSEFNIYTHLCAVSPAWYRHLTLWRVGIQTQTMNSCAIFSSVEIVSFFCIWLVFFTIFKLVKFSALLCSYLWIFLLLILGLLAITFSLISASHFEVCVKKKKKKKITSLLIKSIPLTSFYLL